MSLHRGHNLERCAEQLAHLTELVAKAPAKRALWHTQLHFQMFSLASLNIKF